MAALRLSSENESLCVRNANAIEKERPGDAAAIRAIAEDSWNQRARIKELEEELQIRNVIEDATAAVDSLKVCPPIPVPSVKDVAAVAAGIMREKWSNARVHWEARRTPWHTTSWYLVDSLTGDIARIDRYVIGGSYVATDEKARVVAFDDELVPLAKKVEAIFDRVGVDRSALAAHAEATK